MDPEKTILAGNYLLSRRLGKGAVGAVRLALDIGLDRQVAVKQLHRGAADQGEGRHAERLRREARGMAGLGQCRHVPAIYAFAEADGSPYLVMEYIDGPTLETFMADHYPLPTDVVIAIVGQLMVALAAAHARDLIHRDIKPSNVMIAPDGVVKVLDFGVVAVSDPGATVLTETGYAPGTAAYMAPEIASKGMAEPQSDLYSVGCILFELLAGERVFAAPTSQAMALCHINESPRRIAELRRDIPAWLADLVDRLLSKDPADRPADARIVYEGLRPYLPSSACGRPLQPDPTLPFRDPGGPVTATALEREASEPPARRSRRRAMMKRAELVTARGEASDLAAAGELAEAIKVVDRCLQTALGQFGRLDAAVLALRRYHADLLLVAGDRGAAKLAFKSLRPDAVRTFGEDSAEVCAIDDGITDCEEEEPRP